MGGFGSGSFRRSSRLTSRHFSSIDVAVVRRSGVLAGLPERCRVESSQLIDLEIVATDGGYTFRVVLGSNTGYGFDTIGPVLDRRFWLSRDSMFVQLVSSAPHFGGVRYWFLCPRPTCRRRCRVLYREKRTNARALACRRCYPFVYATQRMSPKARNQRRIDRIASQLVVAPDGRISRPKWMRQRKYDRLVATIESLQLNTREFSFAESLLRSLPKSIREQAAKQIRGAE